MDIASWSAFLQTGVREGEVRSPEESPKILPAHLFSAAAGTAGGVVMGSDFLPRKRRLEALLKELDAP